MRVLHLRWLLRKHIYYPIIFDFLAPTVTPFFNYLALRIPPQFLSFGVTRNQSNSRRIAQLELLINSLPKGSKVLEIGTWFGQGSTQCFLNNLDAADSLFLVDAWRPFISDKDKLKEGGEREKMPLQEWTN